MKHNPFSWNEVADVLYVEQPLRTGFGTASFGSESIRSEQQIGEDFRMFLVSFLLVFPEYKDVEIYLSGESYAGFYIPWIAETIVKYQMKKQKHSSPSGSSSSSATVSSSSSYSFLNIDNVEKDKYFRDISSDHINLAGVAIGNGETDYLYQEPSYAEYAYAHGLIPLAAKKKFEIEWMECLEEVNLSMFPLVSCLDVVPVWLV
jgi:carboxypeptidase C (cathepsin A)